MSEIGRKIIFKCDFILACVNFDTYDYSRTKSSFRCQKQSIDYISSVLALEQMKKYKKKIES